MAQPHASAKRLKRLIAMLSSPLKSIDGKPHTRFAPMTLIVLRWLQGIDGKPHIRFAPVGGAWRSIVQSAMSGNLNL